MERLGPLGCGASSSEDDDVDAFIPHTGRSRGDIGIHMGMPMGMPTGTPMGMHMRPYCEPHLVNLKRIDWKLGTLGFSASVRLPIPLVKFMHTSVRLLNNS